MRSAWKDVGIFDANSDTFIVERKRIPVPPQARAIFETDHLGRGSSAGYELKAACPKCLEPIVTRWQRSYSDHAVEELRYDNTELMAIAVSKEMEAIAKRAEIEAAGSRRREAEALVQARESDERCKRIQIRRSEVRKRKERKRRSKNKGKR